MRGRAALRLGQAQIQARSGARGRMAGRHRHGRRRPAATPVASRARVTLTRTAALRQDDMTDIGTGSYTILAQIVAEMLGVADRQVKVRLGDTDLPPAPARAAHSARPAPARRVASPARRYGRARRRAMDPARRAALQDGTATARNRVSTLAELVGRRADRRRSARSSQGDNAQTMQQAPTARISAKSASTLYRRDAGPAHARRVRGGRILNAKTARSQAIGGMIWGIGCALHEKTVSIRATGAFVNHDLAEYHVPVHADIPEIEACSCRSGTTRQSAWHQGHWRTRHLRRRRGGRQRDLQRLRRARPRLPDDAGQDPGGAAPRIGNVCMQPENRRRAPWTPGCRQKFFAARLIHLVEAAM